MRTFTNLGVYGVKQNDGYLGSKALVCFFHHKTSCICLLLWALQADIRKGGRHRCSVFMRQ